MPELSAEPAPGPLAGIRVLDLTRVLAGPFGTMLLADLGADVIKVESPEGGDSTRANPPFTGGESHYFLSLNRNKRSITLDLGSDDGRAALLELVATADVVVENFRPGVMAARGIGADVLQGVNPRLVVCSISGFGQTGPMRERSAFDVVVQAVAGAMSVNGAHDGPPTKLGVPLGDLAGGIYGAIAVLAALHERQRTGRGTYIDVAMHDGLLQMLTYFASWHWVTGEEPQRWGSEHNSIVPYGVFEASDGHLVVAAFTQRFWVRLCRALGRDEWLEGHPFSTYEGRLAERGAVNERLNEVLRMKSVAEWCALLEGADVPHARINSVGEALAQEQTSARHMVRQVTHPTAGVLNLVGAPIKFPARGELAMSAPPLLGEHNEEILGSERRRRSTASTTVPPAGAAQSAGSGTAGVTSDSEVLRLEELDRCVRLTFTNPRKRNFIDARLRDELLAILAAYDSCAATLVLRSDVPGAFVAGADVAELRDRDPHAVASRHNASLFDAVDRYSGVTIAVIEGVVLGGGLELALACDLRVGTTTSTYGMPEVRLGFVPGGGGMWRLPQVVGPSRASDLILTGRRIDGTEADRIGLLSRLTSPADVSAVVEQLLDDLGEADPLAQRFAKEGLRATAEPRRALDSVMQGYLIAAGAGRDRIERFLR